ncbi:PaaI family thioesterase [Halocalculus aciditolerans]|uniref:Esterase n=1 Tax=Halocalculus aciditolerans TaxID=1383812 RepID=A0A830F7T3_9EURY|nr:PaaI family thioesterase [Halocalculus aciditolerans]GGL48363.1 esterase [Halocalculus aciditolerans]
MTDDYVTPLQDFANDHGYLSWLGVTVEEAEEGRVRLSVPFDEELLNPSDDPTVHGGIAATLVDTASGFVLRTTFEDARNAALTTTDLNVSYLRPVTDDLEADATVVRAGGTMGVADVTIYTTKPSGERTEAATGRATYRLFRDADE